MKPRPDFRDGARAGTHDVSRCPELSAGQLANIAAAMGGNFDADTQQTVTQYFFTVPAEDVDVALHIEALRMRGCSTRTNCGIKSAARSSRKWRRTSGTRVRVLHEASNGHVSGTPYETMRSASRPSFDKLPA